MATQTSPTHPLTEHPTAPHTLATRIAFRFAFVYILLLVLTTQLGTSLLPVPDNFAIPEPTTLPGIRYLPIWTATHLLHATPPVIFDGSGSGDKLFDWAVLVDSLAITTLAVMLWSWLDRRRLRYTRLYAWFRTILRFTLAGQMFAYGIAKMIPLQMSYPSLNKLIEPFGNFSPMGVLWSSVGAAPHYESFVGCAELLGGLLLIFPRTTTLGALICLADMVEVFTLNMTYDVPVKLLSFQLAVFALILLSPEIPRLSTFFFLDQPVRAAAKYPLFGSRKANRIALGVQVLFAIALLANGLYGAAGAWKQYGGGAPHSALYGIWQPITPQPASQLAIQPVQQPSPWRRIVFDYPNSVTFQGLDEKPVSYAASIDTAKQTLLLNKRDDKNWHANFTWQKRPPTASNPPQLILDGSMDNQHVHLLLNLIDATQFTLVSRGFHWVQEYPFER